MKFTLYKNQYFFQPMYFLYNFSRLAHKLENVNPWNWGLLALSRYWYMFKGNWSRQGLGRETWTPNVCWEGQFTSWYVKRRNTVLKGEGLLNYAYIWNLCWMDIWSVDICWSGISDSHTNVEEMYAFLLHGKLIMWGWDVWTFGSW